MKQASSWTRADSIVALASYCNRPPRMRTVPQRELDRVAGLTGHAPETVQRHMQAFAELETGGQAGKRDTRVWQDYSENRFKLMADAEFIVENRLQLPPVLRRALRRESD